MSVAESTFSSTDVESKLRHFRHLIGTATDYPPEFSTTYKHFVSSESLAWAVLLCHGVNIMFKISTIDSASERRLIVEGTLVQPWVAELRRTWSDAGQSLDGRKLVIDLTNATLIDPEGEAAIFELMQEGAKFNCSGVLTRHVLKQAAHRCHMRLQKVLNRRDSKE
jgi:hypothetical protein